MGEQQLYGGTQSVLSTTLLLWTIRLRKVGPGFVDEQHCRGALPFVVRSGHALPA
jgi:hypothetical protein